VSDVVIAARSLSPVARGALLTGLSAPLRIAAETKKLRDACVVTRGEEHCAGEIEAHKVCLRADGFEIK
jgi:hypothetical protein